MLFLQPKSKIGMKSIINTVLIILISLSGLNCSPQKREIFKPKQVYQSANLIVTQLTANTFQHTSFKQTNDFGNVPCNGLVVTSQDEAIVFDTPINDLASKELITWIQEALGARINAIVPTHFHDDSLGGLKAFDEKNIPSYAYTKTIELAETNNYTVPKNSFNDSIILKVGKEKTIVKFFGEGHTIDNVVGFFPSEGVLFGGCLLKELDASKGYLGDANVKDWSSTVEKIKKAYPKIKVVVPGHGEYGDHSLLDYTIQLFKVD